MKIKNRLCFFGFDLCTLIFALLAVPVYAAPDPSGVPISKYFGYGYLTSLGEATSRLVVPVFSLAAFIVTWYFLWGAWDWMLSEGDKQKVADARNKITQAIVGFIILIFAFFILQFMLFKLFNINLGIIGI